MDAFVRVGRRKMRYREWCEIVRRIMLRQRELWRERDESA